MKKIIPLVLLSSIMSVAFTAQASFSSSVAKDTSIENKALQNEDDMLNRIRGKFVISGASKFYHPKLNYGGYLIAKEHLNNDLCATKKPGALYLLDHEGGLVKRIQSDTPSAEKSKSLPSGAYEKYWDTDMKAMQKYCIDSILGPTVDIGMGGGRSYSEKLDFNFKSIEPLLKVSENNKILSVVKHFPGLLLRCDPIPNSKEQHYCVDKLPFIDKMWGPELDKHQPEALMVSHYYYNTSKKHPAMANEEILSYLRDTKKFSGVLLTDSIWEVTQEISPEEILNMYKYNDLILVMDYKHIESMVDVIYEKIQKDPEWERYLTESEQRVRAWRKSIPN